MNVVYLDTNHLSRLARHPDDATSLVVREILDSGNYHLGLSWLHLQDLSAPTFTSRDAVGALLDQVTIAWAPWPDEVFDREIRWGIEFALSGERVERQVFSSSFEHAMGAPAEANVAVSQMLQGLAERPDLRDHLREAARKSALADSRLKKAAAIVSNRDEPMLARIRDLNTTISPSGLELPRRYPAEDILRRAGGPSGFPALNVADSLAHIRLNDASYPTRENDIVDEWHACYAPYCVAAVLDRGTTRRFHMAHLPSREIVTHTLADLPLVLQNRLTRRCS